MSLRKLETAGLVLLALVIATGAGAGRPGGEDGPDAFARRVKERAAPLVTVEPGAGTGDLDALRGIVGDAKIVCLGESQHLMREQYQLKHRIVRYLVETLGFTHIAIEDSLFGTIAVDDHIKGADTSAEDVLRGTGGWYLWDTEEMLALVRWLRSHNDGVDGDRKVSYVGLDIQDPRPGIGLLLGYFGRVDPRYASSLEARRGVFDVFDKPIWIQIKGAYPALGGEGKRALADTLKEVGERLEARREEYIETGGAKAHGDAVLTTAHLLKSHEYFLELEDDKGEVGVRERAMFEGVVRIKETAGPRARIVVWVHNAHAAKSPVRFLNTGIPESLELALLGTMLEREYGDEVRSIGMVSLGTKQEGKDLQALPDVLDHAFAGTGLDLFLLDLGRWKNGNGSSEALARPWKLTADMGGYLSLVPAEAYDGLVFIKHVTGVRRSAEGTRRFNALF